MSTGTEAPGVLVYGYGNPGRQDDGLGIAFVRELETMGIPGCAFDENYQLNVEDALTISRFPLVIFADASIQGGTFSLSPLHPDREIGFTTHAMHPASVLALCNELYSAFPRCWLLALSGFEWEMKEGLSERAAANLKLAVEAFLPVLRSEDPEAGLRRLESIT